MLRRCSGDIVGGAVLLPCSPYHVCFYCGVYDVCFYCGVYDVCCACDVAVMLLMVML